ncbi:THUMP domain-containing protein 2 [Diretmus argenteus]
MSEPGGGRSLVRYYCTAGSGMEAFLVREVKEKLAAEHVSQIPGKVLFSSSAGITRVRELKAAERLFLLLRRDSPVLLPAQTSPAKVASVLQSRLLGDRSEWDDAVMTWSRLQRELASRNTVNTPSTAMGFRKRLETSRTDEIRRKPSRDEPDPPAVPVSFRISCKSTGALTRRLSSQELSRVIGVGLSRMMSWKIDLKNPQLEVSVYLSDDHSLLGIPLTRLPLANRRYMKTTGLRSTVAWAMGSLAQIQPGSCVVDPMCGGGTILIEAAQEHKDAHFLGVDIDDGQLQRANENAAFADLKTRINLLKASSLDLPLPSGAVDAVVSDLPFGRKFSSKSHMAANLPIILTEMERILRVGGVLVLLLSPQLSCLLKKLQTNPGPGPTSTQETEPRAGLHHLPSPLLTSTEQETVQIQSTSTQGAEPPTGLPDCSSPPLTSTEPQTFQNHPWIQSTAAQGPEPLTGLRLRLPAPLSSLKHQATYRVSLGAIDGLIHKYVKIEM